MSRKRPLAPVVLSIAGTLALASPAFAMNDVADAGPSGDVARDSHGSCGEGRCGAGRCGANPAPATAQPPAAPDARERAHFIAMDRNADGRISREEFAAAHRGSLEQFAGHDGNGDGSITFTEMQAAHAAMAAARAADQATSAARAGDAAAAAAAAAADAASAAADAAAAAADATRKPASKRPARRPRPAH